MYPKRRRGGRPICIVMQGEGARGREEKVKTAEADLECQDFEMVTRTAALGRPGMPTLGRGQGFEATVVDLACPAWAGARISRRKCPY